MLNRDNVFIAKKFVLVYSSDRKNKGEAIMNLIEERKWIQKELEAVANFWLTNGMDKKHGGVYTCLDKDGKVFSTDKSVWMQGRCGWMFSYLYNNIEV